MTERRRRRLRRDALVLLGSIVVHIGLFFVAASEFTYYSLPQENAPAVEVQIVPQPVEEIPPPPPIVQPTPRPTPQPPTPQAQPQPTRQPPKPVLPPTPPQPVTAPSAAPQSAQTPTPLPASKPAPSVAVSPLAPPATVSASQSHAAAAPHIILHKSRDAGAPLTSGLNLPGATFAPPPQAAAPGGGAPGGVGGPAGGGLPGGRLPGFGSGLRGGPLGCANAAVLHLTPAEQARCDEAFGEGARQSPRMDPIGSAKRQEFNSEAAQEEAARKYRDSMPSESADHPTPGQPKILQTPGH
jgi:hypothetical protein